MSVWRAGFLQSLQHSLSKIVRPSSSLYHLSYSRTFAFSSAEEAAAERRRRKRRLRIEPPLHALRPNVPPPPRDPNAPRLPDSTSALTGPRLNLHNRVQSLIRSGQLDAASATARQAVFSRTRPTVFTCNAITASMLRAGRFDDVLTHFQYFFEQSNIVPNVVSYNILINSHCEAGRVDAALDVYRHILDHAPFGPSYITYRHLTKGLVDSSRISEAIDLLREMLNKGHGADSIVYNTLMDGFIKLGNMPKALELFGELKERCLVYDGVVHATLMEEYFRKGMAKEAMDSYKQLLDRQFNMNAVTCNTLMEVLMKHGKLGDALALFDHMLETHKPTSLMAVNTDSYNMVVNEHFRLGQFETAITLFRKMGLKPCQMDVGCYNNIISKLCAEQGWVEEAEKLLDEMPTRSVEPDVVTFEYLLDGYFRERKVDDALRCFGKMLGYQALKGTANFYNKLIFRLVEQGWVQEAVNILHRMKEKEVNLDSFSYEPVITAFCNVGQLDDARCLLEEMIRNHLALSPALHETVLNAFNRDGWREDIQRLLGGSTANTSLNAAPHMQVAL